MKISVIGSGYVGLVSGACLAEVGHSVMCFDIDRDKIARLKRGEIPIYEPQLDQLILRNLSAGTLDFTDDVQTSVAHGDIQFIAVGTPPDEDGSADLQYVLAAARDIATHMTSPKILVDKSTVPVGTADRVKALVAEILQQRGVDLDFSVVSNPEFLKEGAAINDFMKPDRIIIGAEDAAAVEKMRQLYAPFQRNHERLLVMDIRSAELSKYAANAMLATRISFMNELARLAEKLGADIEKVRQGIGSDPRIGYHFLYAGAGFGGSCFPKDVAALCHMGEENGVDLKILSAVSAANAEQKRLLADKILAHYGEDLCGKRFALWGLAFKPNTDDMREAPSLVIIERLLKHGARLAVYDPVAMTEAQKHLAHFNNIEFCTSRDATLSDADALIIVTEWQAFRTPDFAVLAAKLRDRRIYDGRNLYDLDAVADAGLTYFPIGRKQGALA